MNILYLVITSSSICLAIISAWLMKNTYHTLNEMKKNNQKKPRFIIAILTPSLSVNVANCTRPFLAHIKKYATFEFETIECIHHLEREQAQEWANFIVENKIDLVLAVGQLSTEIIYHTMKTRHHQIPIVSAGLPIDHSEISLETVQSQIPFTAVATKMQWLSKMIILKKIIPHLKTVLIISRSMDEISRNSLQEKNAITTALRKLHINWKMHHAPHIEKTTDLNAELLAGVDIIILSRSSEVLIHASRITQEAQQFNIPVIAPDVANPDVFIGIAECSERSIGIQSAQYAIEILEDEVPASELPIKEIAEKTTLIINPHSNSPMMAATAIGNLLAQSNQINIVLKQN